MGPRRDKGPRPQSKRPGGHCRSRAPWHQTGVATTTGNHLQQEGRKSPPPHQHRAVAQQEPVTQASSQKDPERPAAQGWPPGQPGSYQHLSVPITGRGRFGRGKPLPAVPSPAACDHRASQSSQDPRSPTRPQNRTSDRRASPARSEEKH
ncbi:hypothetical protein NDU88_006687 [Pleurodeles waltl]|uniref:Uncharacterized protein n=1 Tax=Pleurodeles waltl TaxID=8319 RepID=A0AAV7LT99_PLEWA|nr:hypothetical protein NDU88_006687 [Pleurodeles waltl]